MSDAFRLPADIEAASLPLSGLELCEARLMNDARFVWIVLVPRRAGAVEVEDLAPDDRAVLLEECLEAGRRVRAIGAALGRPVDKLNVAALGNVTRTLHVHVIGRRADDAAWPRPVWGVGEAIPWEPAALSLAQRCWQG
ncbi:MAG: HIT domain-containing protein [Alphaproteobacteria bacterium]